MSTVILQCVKIGSKLRVRFSEFIDEKGAVYNNSYDNNYNCQFPKNIRKEGRYYKIPHSDISLKQRGISQPFYSVRKHNIEIIENRDDLHPMWNDLENVKIYDAVECVVCMENDSEKLYLPCGHKCVCDKCSELLCKIKKECPLCRRYIQKII